MRKVTCYAWGRPGDWEGICVDFDLPAQGSSLEEVRRELNDAIETYLGYVTELPENEQARFLNRKIPLWLRLRLAFLHRVFALLNWLNLRTEGKGIARAGFVVSAP